jgi:hypothetical protein
MFQQYLPRIQISFVTSILLHLDFSKDFMGKGLLYITQSVITVFGVILMHLNRSGVNMRPPL